MNQAKRSEQQAAVKHTQRSKDESIDAHKALCIITVAKGLQHGH
jgi:hypothetical protein